MKLTAISCLLFVSLVSVAFAQFPQMERARERMDTSERASEERARAEKENANTKSAIPPAKMNVDVQMLLAKLEYKTFADAKPNAVTRIGDGDALWLYVKFNGTLGRYVYTMQQADGSERYILFAEIGPAGDVTAKAHYWIEFRKDELTLTELKMSLSPGKAGHNKSLPIFIKTVGGGRPGLWNNELRLANIPALPRGMNDYLAKADVLCDLTHGLAKYPKMIPEFQSIVLRDTTDETKLPIEGKFDDATVRASVASRVAGEGIAPSKIYFAGDAWTEYSDIPTQLRQIRTVTAVFTYQKGNACFYGTADVFQIYDGLNGQFGEPTISVRKDLTTPCVTPK